MKKSVLIICLLLLFSACSIAPKITSSDNVSIQALQSEVFFAEFKLEKQLKGSEEYDSSLVSYFSDELKIYALINRPATAVPEHGYPIVIFGHGFHPEPKKYGVSNSTGKNWRPGDYYRGMPETFAKNGYLAITPDYRGHNVSEGYEFTEKSILATSYYARDVLNAVAALASLENVDLDNVFYLGHSMGGEVGLKVLLSTNKFKAASLWAPVSGTTMQQALYYGKYYDEKNDKVDQEIMQVYTQKIEGVYESLSVKVDYADVDPIHHLQWLTTPIIIHHARSETSVPYIWSENLIAQLHELEKTYQFYSYDSANHLFKNENLELAFKRDVDFFSKYLN